MSSLIPWSGLLWALAVLTYGFGDFLTTIRGLQRDGIEERQSGARIVLGEPPSMWRFGLFKGLLLTVFFVGYVLLEGYRFRIAIPAGIAVIGSYAVLNNGRVLLDGSD
ncbi:hypothetical protein EA462_08455 [Natrarchaeobius halalkaliphilus]|uniref:Uncharacterized protein n=1 Tax=Natrarchaeobius halalkaliphilus TaxID=1679091 RepID=A0A3N6LPG1_9EURY|nr:hypothetical protein [Natrarchaeobius halalkaliphilus]RQG90027.1 hypothetical protein EA462_08455 [Natrarchaeobius halalkaliphilus]